MARSANSHNPSPLYFQHVTIWWTKRSRGMPQAQTRAQLPRAYSLSAAEIALLGNGGIHLVTLAEQEDFTPHREVRPLPDKTRIGVGAVTARATATGAHLSYRYNGLVGAPDRSHRPPVEFDVALGRRARVAYNGRFSGYGVEWIYKLSVVTIAVGIAPGVELFTHTPHHNVEDLVELF